MPQNITYPMIYKQNGDDRNTYDSTSLINGNAVVNSSIISSSSIIMAFLQRISGQPGFISSHYFTPGASFHIDSTQLADNSLINWILLYDTTNSVPGLNMSLLWGKFGTQLATSRTYGKATLSNGTVTIDNSYINNPAVIFVSVDTPVNREYLTVQVQPLGNFIINSSNNFDNSIVNWMAIIRTADGQNLQQDGGIFVLDSNPTTATYGTAILVAGTATVNTTSVRLGDLIMVSYNLITFPGPYVRFFLSAPVASIIAGTSFVINSENSSDDSIVNWWILRTSDSL